MCIGTAQLLFSKGNLTDSIKKYELVLDISPHNVKALHDLSGILYRTGSHYTGCKY